MEIKNITNEKFANEWNKFVIENSSPASFLQSWQWGSFKQEKQNVKVFRFAIFNNEKLVCVAQFFKAGLPGGKFYLNCPKGPCLSAVAKAMADKLIDSLILKIKENFKDVVFIRIAAPYESNGLPAEALAKSGLKKPKILTNLKEPENSLVLNLENSEHDILKNMHQKTRYNIRLAEKKGIKIQDSGFKIQEDLINEIYELIKETAQRDKINVFNKSYYENLLNYFNDLQATSYKLQANLFTASFENKILSAIIVVGFGNTVTYLYGASSNEHRNLMPNYLIQWQAIKWAKHQGYKFYDFWGINKKKNKWSGITRFKLGFVSEKTGREINFIGTFDCIIKSMWYNLYRIGKIIKL